MGVSGPIGTPGFGVAEVHGQVTRYFAQA